MRFTTAARSDRRKFASNAGTQPNVPSIIFVTRVSGAPSASAAIRPMREVVDRQLAPWRFAALLFSLLAALALVVAAVGLSALLAHQVTARTPTPSGEDSRRRGQALCRRSGRSTATSRSTSERKAFIHSPSDPCGAAL